MSDTGMSGSGMSSKEPSGWAVGWTFFAAFMMIMMGCFQAIAGLAGIFNDEFYVKTRDYVFKFDSTTWGWIHLIWGTIVVLAGFGLFTGAVWARIIGVLVAFIAALIGFAWLPWYPLFAITWIAISIAVIWALTTHGRDIAMEG